MRNFILITFLLFSIVGYTQTKEELNTIDRDYNHYLKNVFEPTFTKEKKDKEIPSSLIFGKIDAAKKQMQLNNNKTFSVSFDGNDNKIIAAILHGVKHFSTYQFLADDYEQINQSKDLVLKEYLRLKVHIIPDTNTMELIKTTKVNSLENLNTYKLKGMKRVKHPYVISYFTSHRETGNDMGQTTKILISQNGNVIYSTNKIGSKVIVNHQPSINRFNFVYQNNGTKNLVSGGLMNYSLNKVLNKIKEEKHASAINISNVKDYYKKQNKDLKRISNTGRLNVKEEVYENILSMN